MIDLGVNLGGLELKNPVITASGTYGFGKEYGEFYDISALGGITVTGLTLEPRSGNKPPRLAETPAGILNSVGLENRGIDRFMEEEISLIDKYNVPIIANISGYTVEEYCIMAEKLSNKVDAIELNVSCPNVKEGGMAFGIKAESIYQITSAAKKYARVPLIVKLSPNVTDIGEMAKAAEAGGADCISLINTLTGMKIDIERKRPYFENIVAGLSGPAIKPIALRMVWQASREVSIPIIGMGGITSWEDAIEFLMAGADAIAIGTANFINPYAPLDILEGLQNYMKENNIVNISSIKIV